ncbi:MAG: FxsA family protein [Acidimicrobiales bacterium]
MLGVLVLLFVVVPIAELYVIVQVAGGIGVGETILLLIAVSVVGAWLAKLAGIGVLNRLQRTVQEGRVPSGEVVDGALVLFAGALMMTPGFLSDCLAILLLLPPTRAVARNAILRRIRSGGGLVTVVAGGRRGPQRRPSGNRPQSPDQVWDVDSWEDPPDSSDHPGLGR